MSTITLCSRRIRLPKKGEKTIKIPLGDEILEIRHARKTLQRTKYARGWNIRYGWRNWSVSTVADAQGIVSHLGRESGGCRT